VDVLVGEAVGPIVGESLGDLVGDIVGEAVGPIVGKSVGERVGGFDGLFVSLVLGTGVSTTCCCRPQIDSPIPTLTTIASGVLLDPFFISQTSTTSVFLELRKLDTSNLLPTDMPARLSDPPTPSFVTVT
jgi:hypothetical protein